MIDISSIEPLTRLRRLFNLRGKTQIGLEENLVPTVLTLDATEPGRRDTPWLFGTGVTAPAGGAGQWSAAGIQNNGQLPIIVDTVVCFVPAVCDIRLGGFALPVGAALAAGARATEGQHGGSQLIPVTPFITNTAGAADPITDIIFRATVTTNTSLLIPIPGGLLVNPGFSFMAAPQAVNLAVGFACWGRFYG